MGDVLCVCCSGLTYAECCKPLHEGQAAPTPLALMRSRYSAYALGLSAYIQKTTHPDSPYFEPDRMRWEKAISEFCETTRFVKLEILGSGPDWVSFAAHLEQKGEAFVLLEKSLFKKKNGCWRYVSGEITRKKVSAD